MPSASWQALVELVRPHIVRIMTPRGSGTGFLLYNSPSKRVSAIATAAHVINSAHYWEEPIRLQRADDPEETTILRAADRAILLNLGKDAGAIIFQAQDLGLPIAPLTLGARDKFIRVGVEIGWLGFPAVARELCFFSGRVSTYIESEERYLVDGVAINGVSGGPAFCSQKDGTAKLIGVLSAYIPNRATGEALPGLAVVSDVVEFHKMIAAFKSLEDAQTQETPPTEAPPTKPEQPTPPAPPRSS